MKVSGRFIIAIFSTLLEETGIAAIVLWGLPYLGVHIPLAGLIVLMIVWGAYAVITYRMGSRALMRKPVAGLGDVIGSSGKVVRRLAPNGVIRVGSELWEATSAGRRIKVGEEVTVLGRDGLRLIVSKSNSSKRK